MKKLRGYIFARPFMGERVPQHVQNIVLRDYCAKKNQEILLAVVEYAMPNSFLMMESLVNQPGSEDGILMYSITQLPVYPFQRETLYHRIIESGRSLHFAVDGMLIEQKCDVAAVEQCLLVKATLDKCISKVEI